MDRPLVVLRRDGIRPIAIEHVAAPFVEDAHHFGNRLAEREQPDHLSAAARAGEHVEVLVARLADLLLEALEAAQRDDRPHAAAIARQYSPRCWHRVSPLVRHAIGYV